MLLDTVFTRFDECFEAASLDAVVLTDPVVADMKAEKVKTGLTPFLSQDMGDAGFIRA